MKHLLIKMCHKKTFSQKMLQNRFEILENYVNIIITYDIEVAAYIIRRQIKYRRLTLQKKSDCNIRRVFCGVFILGETMKDISKLKDYRLKYKRYYGIDFGSDYAIHHIDFNKKNNDISNLLLLPKELHSKYHMIINAITICPQKIKADGFIDVRLSNFNITTYNAKIFRLLPEIMEECNKWLQYKHYKYDNAVLPYIWRK